MLWFRQERLGERYSFRMRLASGGCRAASVKITSKHWLPHLPHLPPARSCGPPKRPQLATARGKRGEAGFVPVASVPEHAQAMQGLLSALVGFLEPEFAVGIIVMPGPKKRSIATWMSFPDVLCPELDGASPFPGSCNSPMCA